MNKEIEQLINEFAKKRYQEGYDDGYKDGAISGYMTSYQEGLNDAWECARKLISDSEVRDVFGDYTSDEIIENFSASEAVAKLKDYEEKQKQTDTEIRVGDEVIVKGDRAIVIKVDIDYWYRVVYENGNTDYIHSDTITGKTGKHYDAIEEVLKELRRDEDNADSN